SEPVQARPVGWLERIWKWARRRPALAALLGVSVLAAVGLLTGGVWLTVQSEQDRQKQANHAANESRLRKEADEGRLEAQKQTALALQREKELKETLGQLAVLTGLAADDAWDLGRGQHANGLLLKIPADFRGWEWRFRQRRFLGGYCTLTGHT